MMIFLILLLVAISLFLIIFVLIQSDKGGGLAGSLGGMGGGSNLFGGSGAGNVLTKITTGLAIAYMVLCVAIFYISRDIQSTGKVSSELRKRAMDRKEVMPSAALDYSQEAPSSAVPSEDPFGLGQGPQPSQKAAPPQGNVHPSQTPAPPAQEPVDMFDGVQEGK